MREYDGQSDEPFPDPWDGEPVELITPEHFLRPDGIPHDARRMGLDRNTQEGAMLALAGSLKPGKLSHRVMAVVLLAAFAMPTLLWLVRPLL